MFGCGILACYIIEQQARAKIYAEQEKRFNALPREEQGFQLLKRQTEALERIARQGPPQVTIKNRSSLF
jgi:hypothetical protein